MTKYLKVRRMSHRIKVHKPRRLAVGWWLSNLAGIFVLVPIVYERTLFIQNTRWLASFAIAATLTITGLALMNSALGQELWQLEQRDVRKKRR